MQISDIHEYQQRIIRQVEEYGPSVRFSNRLSKLLETYQAAAATPYVQLPFVIEQAEDIHPCSFWVRFDDGPEPVALAGFRALRNGGRKRRVGEACSQGALYRCEKKEGWLPGSGPQLEADALYGYIGAGWVHPRWRGRNLAGFIARIAQAEALLRSGGSLALSTAVTAEELHLGGMSLRASGLHHRRAELVLEGYMGMTGREVRVYLSHSSGNELMRIYEAELAMLRVGEAIPWLHRHDKVHAAALLQAWQAEASSLDWRINARSRVWDARRPDRQGVLYGLPDHARCARPRSQAAA